VGVLLGSCDNGAEESKAALAAYLANGAFPAGYSLAEQSAELPARFLAGELGLESFALVVSTACTSSASALALARKLIGLGVCDAVVAGGVDIVSDTVLLGFHALEAVDLERCKPFSATRRGINLGEGAALFLMTRAPLVGWESGLVLAGSGETADAHHMTAPDPSGQGAARAMRAALAEAGLEAGDIGYINLHGTGTPLNDAMESRATHEVFGAAVPCSSTKALVGHTLGAAGAMELGFCWLIMSALNPEHRLPPQVWDGAFDPELPAIGLTALGARAARLDACMSNSYAFGGCNVSLIIARL
jgi:3-oxoacyl-[acyl-carrier-protein] synthase-1